MNIVTICNYLYPGEHDKGNIKFIQEMPDGPIKISHWAVEGEDKPEESYLESLIPQYLFQFNFDKFKLSIDVMILALLDETAKLKGYDSSISITSYLNSTVEQWRLESTCFSSWRDSVYEYYFNQLNEIENVQREIPDIEDFKNELPLIQWPEQEVL